MSSIGSASGEASTESAVIRACWSPARPGPVGGEPPLEDLAQGPLLDPGDAADLLERLVAAERVVDVADATA